MTPPVCPDGHGPLLPKASKVLTTALVEAVEILAGATAAKAYHGGICRACGLTTVQYAAMALDVGAEVATAAFNAKWDALAAEVAAAERRRRGGAAA